MSPCDNVIRQWPGRVLIGYDGSRVADEAVAWAVREVAARGSSLRLGSSELSSCFHHRVGDGGGQQNLIRLVREIHEVHPSLVVDFVTTQGDPRQALIDEAATSDLLVLAAPTDESSKMVLLGSLARAAIRRSPCPVVVFRGTRTGPVHRIVLGVDGSSAAGTALDWACTEANLHHADLLVIHCRERDISRAEAGCVLDLAVNECRERTSARVRGVLSDDPPAAALVEASHDADLVTIGSRGRSGFKTAVFGSVALSVAERACCPVGVTHPRPRCD
jgi:nucleotide-binding universal stress UspA family protein